MTRGRRLAIRGPRVSAAGVAALVAILAIGPAVLVGPAEAGTGGPDAYGYVWVDSRPPSPVVPFSWIDITSTGARLSLGDDQCTFELSLGFQFRFYGSIMDQVFVCSNGFLTFGVPDSFYADPPIPSPAPPNSRVVALGIDLNPSVNGGVYVKSEPTASPRRFVVTWDRVYRTYTTQPQTFQIVLEQNETTKDGRILLQYRDLTGISSALVGIENATGSSGLAYPELLENLLAVAFLPPSDATLPPDTLQVGSASLAPPTVTQGMGNVPMLELDVSTATNDIRVAMIEVTLSGLGAGPEDVSGATLWLDDGDGAFVPGADAFLDSAPFVGAPPKARLEPIGGRLVVPGAPLRFFVSYDIASTAGTGDWIGARLPDASAISVGFPDLVDPNDFPIDTYVPSVRTRIDPSRDSLLLLAAEPLLPSTIARWETDVPLLALNLTANRNFVDVEGLRVPLGGNATQWDIWAVKAVRDLDGDGNYTPRVDEVLDVAAPTGASPAALLAFSLTVAAGTVERLLLLVDVGPNATLGNVVNATLSATDVQLPVGSVDRTDAANFPAASGPGEVVPGPRPTLRLPWVDSPPRPDGIWQAGEYLLSPDFSASLDRPAGNRVPGFVTAQNNATTLFLAVDSVDSLVPTAGYGVVVSFDTDGDGRPTPGADDAFVVNGTGGARLQYNASAGAWTVVASCSPATGPVSVPSCAAGFGVTQLRPYAHRFYEFGIPVDALGLATPVAPGASLRFAVAGPIHGGLADSGNRSTWPLLFAFLAPLEHFGDLALASGPAPNQPPMLTWTGEPGYTTDALDPETGLWNATFRWRILYVDPDNDAPALGQPLLYVFRDASAVAGSPFEMVPGGPKGGDYRNGEPFARSLTDLPCGGNYTYHVAVRDARGLPATSPTLSGPMIWCPDQPPALSGETVAPLVATAPATFTYRVAYADPEGRPPRGGLVEAEILFGTIPLTPPSLSIVGWIGAVDDFRAGAWYAGSILLTEPGTNYSFRFRAADDNTTVETPPTLGPYVLAPPPDVLTVAGADLAPLIVNEGSRLVPFYELYLLTSSPGVDVTRIRVDRTGTVGDAEVQRILLYRDVDASASITGPDGPPLGIQSPAFGTAYFAVSLHVDAASPVALLFALNLTKPGTPDATVGLEVKDATYVSVGAGDVVQPFAFPFRSTRALVNVPPNAMDLTVDGFGEGTAGITHVSGASPSFAWRFADANGGDVAPAAHNVSVSSLSPPNLLWYQNGTGGATSAVYGGSPLGVGSAYVLSVSVSDGELWSAPAAVVFRLNTPPPAPALFSPGDGSVDLAPDVTLLWLPVADPEGDPLTYWYWVSEDVGFTAVLVGTTDAPGIALSLAAATTYYWKVGASDGYAFAGNATVWRFTTRDGGPPPTRGEIRGRVMNGTAPLSGALVEVLVDGLPASGMVTGSNGTFIFRDLEFRAYTVRVSAYGFVATTVQAEPADTAPVVDLGDIPLRRATDGGTGKDGNVSATIPLWFLLLALALAVGLGVSSTFLTLLFKARRRERTDPESQSPQPEESPGDEHD